ncbi:MAG: winged helix-turn-helix transcriptional regulator [Rhodospirillales bacterium]|nr:MAG: winged helix-turn-helix transcriptional regulator [Rhodospirillales bacterium]
MPANPAPASLALEDFLPYRLSLLSQLVSASIHDLYFEPSGLTIPQWRVMAVLGRFAPLSAGEVCGRTLLDKVSVSRAVATLRGAGHLESAVDGDDRRRSALRLSAKGRRLHDRIVPLALDYERRLLAALSPADRRTLDRLMAALSARARTLRAAILSPGAPVV